MVSEPKATRFFWTLDQAVDLIFNCMHKAENSSPYLPSMKSMSLANLLEAMASKYLPEGETLEIVQIGLSKGENFHERILEDGPSSDEAEQFTIEEIKEFI